MQYDEPPKWLGDDPEGPPPGFLVNKALKRARSGAVTREIVELCVGNIFSTLLILLAPFFKSFAEAAIVRGRESAQD
ncbi:MAG: hypothetical protein HKN85_09805 [Gammaproteobacteria bacterium]|nr:hypothetical protein [Gammaproteobacteria bacterium]